MPVGRELDNLRSRVLDVIAYIKIFGPSFPAEAQTTIQIQFSKLFELLQSLAKVARGTDQKRWLELALQESRDSLLAFNEAREHEARMLLHSAEQHFRNYLDKRMLRPTFLVTPDGIAERNE
jgi:hypothetical protein